MLFGVVFYCYRQLTDHLNTENGKENLRALNAPALGWKPLLEGLFSCSSVSCKITEIKLNFKFNSTTIFML